MNYSSGLELPSLEGVNRPFLLCSNRTLSLCADIEILIDNRMRKCQFWEGREMVFPSETVC